MGDGDEWLNVLNQDGERLVCTGHGRRFSMLQLRNKIHYLQGEIKKQKYQEWILCENDRFNFICNMFALLLSNRDVLVPPSRQEAEINSLMLRDVGLIGFPQNPANFSVEFPADIDSQPGSKKLAGVRQWGRVVLNTSGSSGKPKSIVKSASQLYEEAMMLKDAWQISPATIFIPQVTHCHMYGLVFSLLLPLVCGCGFYLPRSEGILAAVEKLAIDAGDKIDKLVVVTSPTIGRHVDEIKTLAEAGSVVCDKRPATVSRVYTAGSKLTDENALAIINLFDCTVTEIFGSTETGAVATREHSKGNPKDKIPWKLFSHLNAMAMDSESGTTAQLGSPGNFAVWGGHVRGSKEKPVMTGDEVEFVDHRHFHFLTRNNQIYKIEGKRVSIDKFVEAAEKCNLVDECIALPHTIDSRETLLCGVVLSEKGKSHYHQWGKAATDHVIRTHLLQFFEPTLVPRKIRYLDKISRNSHDKLPMETLEKLLINPEPQKFPLIKGANINKKQITLDIVIPLELIYLRGHFDSHPLVPGVILLHWIYCYSEKYWQIKLNLQKISRIKFTAPIHPGDQLLLSLQKIKNRVDFVYQNDRKAKAASGSILV